VLIVDDSLLFREMLAREITRDPGIEVVGTASDPFEAKDKIIALRPQVLTLDIEMPRMNGIAFLRQLMPQYPIPVVMVSSVSERVFDALNAGAVDFVTKPDLKNAAGTSSLIHELIVKIKIASTAKVGFWKHENSKNIVGTAKIEASNDKIIAIGASTGGTEAIAQIMGMLPKEMPGIVIVQHMPPVFTKMYAERLNHSCLLEVIEARDGDKVYPGRVLIAPGDYHMRIKKKGSVYSVECLKGDKVNGHCPSVEVLFESVADQCGKNAIGVILTGMGYDGAKGLLKMRQRGARTLGQNEASSVVYGMPKVAYDLGAVEKQLSLQNIANGIKEMLEESDK